MLSPPLPPSPGAVVARAAARVGEDARAVLIEEVLLPLSASDEAALVDLEAHVPPGDRLLASARWVVMRRATDRRGALGALLEWTLGADAMADARAREACRQQLAQCLEEDRALAATAVDLTAAALERGAVDGLGRENDSPGVGTASELLATAIEALSTPPSVETFVRLGRVVQHGTLEARRHAIAVVVPALVAAEERGSSEASPSDRWMSVWAATRALAVRRPNNLSRSFES